MHIHFYHQFFAGKEAPGPMQPRMLVQMLAERGHTVDIIASDFNVYNEQDEIAELYHTSKGGVVAVHRLRTPRNVRTSLLNRLRTYAVYAWRAYWFGRTLKRPDVVMTSIQPLFSGVAAYKMAQYWKAPFLLEIRDLWPDALVVKKAISRWQAYPLEKMARMLYLGASRVVSLTPGIKIELLKKGVSPAKLDLLPNGFNPEFSHSAQGMRTKIRSDYGWNEQFVAIYTGTHTEVTAIDVIVKAADALKARKDIRFDLFGTGQSKAKAMALAKQMELTNIHFHEAVPKSKIPALLEAADVGIMTLFKSPLIHIYFENKLIDYMGAKKPIVAAMDGIQAELITRYGAGKVTASFDYKGLAELIEETCDNPDQAKQMGEAGYRFVSTRLVQKTILEHYVERLESLACGNIQDVPAWDPLA